MKARTGSAFSADFTISPVWKKALRSPAAICRRAAGAAFAHAPKTRKPSGPVDVAVVLTSDAAVRKLNALYRGKDKATDVLSFPAWSGAAEPHPGREFGRESVTLGDIIIAYATTTRDAKAEYKTLAEHLTHLVVHGVLHLLGYDHEHDRDAATMERLEIAVLKTLGITNPYVARPAPRPARAKPATKRAVKRPGKRKRSTS